MEENIAYVNICQLWPKKNYQIPVSLDIYGNLIAVLFPHVVESCTCVWWFPEH